MLEERLGGGKRPSSTTQSLRSRSEVFRPRLGGDGDGLVAAMTGWREAETIAGGGDSRKSIGSACVVRDSNADIPAWTVDILEQGQMTTTDLYAVAGPFSNEILSAPSSISPIDFCLIPIGTANSSVAEEVAECQRILTRSGLVYTVSHFMRTTVCNKMTFFADAVHLEFLFRNTASANFLLTSGYGTNIGEMW